MNQDQASGRDASRLGCGDSEKAEGGIPVEWKLAHVGGSGVEVVDLCEDVDGLVLGRPSEDPGCDVKAARGR